MPELGREVGMRRSTAARRREQTDYRRAYRARQKTDRKPSRDDVARIVLHWVVTDALRRDGPEVPRLRAELIRRLVAQGFSETHAAARVDDIVERYEDGWTFQRKPHLLADDA